MTKIYAAISSDVVSSTSLSSDSIIGLNERIKKGLNLLSDKYTDFWGRIVRGDTIECICSPSDALEIALILKTWVKSYEPSVNSSSELFGKYGLRISIGIGSMNILNKELDIMDGDAIYRSGRRLDKLTGWSKYSMSISMDESDYERPLSVILGLINQLLNNATPRKCRILSERLITGSSSSTAEKCHISVSGVNQVLNDLGWITIKEALSYYQSIFDRHVD